MATGRAANKILTSVVGQTDSQNTQHESREDQPFRRYSSIYTSGTAQGGGGSCKDRLL